MVVIHVHLCLGIKDVNVAIPGNDKEAFLRLDGFSDKDPHIRCWIGRIDPPNLQLVGKTPALGANPGDQVVLDGIVTAGAGGGIRCAGEKEQTSTESEQHSSKRSVLCHPRAIEKEY